MSPSEFGRGFNKLQNEDETEDADYKRLVSSISQNIQSMSNNVASIRSLLDSFNPETETTSNLFDDLQRRQHNTNLLAHRIGDDLLRLSQTDSMSKVNQIQHKMRLERFKNHFADILKTFQTIQRIAAEKEKAYIKVAKHRSAVAAERPLIEGVVEPSYTQEQEQLQEEMSIYEIERRERAIRKLEEDIMGVNDIFRDLATMIHEQGDMIDSIEANVESTAQNITSAGTQLRKAGEYQARSRKKIMILLAILAVVVIVLSLIIYFSVRKK